MAARRQRKDTPRRSRPLPPAQPLQVRCLPQLNCTLRGCGRETALGESEPKILFREASFLAPHLDRARENFRYYIVNSRKDWTAEEFAQSSADTVFHYVANDMENICQG